VDFVVRGLRCAAVRVFEDAAGFEISDDAGGVWNPCQPSLTLKLTCVSVIKIETKAPIGHRAP